MQHPYKTRNSHSLYEEAKRHLVGGVNSPVRAFGAVGGDPIFFLRGRGPWLEDVDGNRYLDLTGSWGALILGHRPLPVVNAVRRQIRRAFTFGAPCAEEIRLAERVKKRCPFVEKLRFVSSGTEAVMSALRLARAATGRPRVVKFDGGYHGHSDFLLVQAGSGPAAFGHPDSPGVPPEATAFTLSLPYNDAAAVARAFELHPDIAAVVVEPVAGNMGVIPPKAGFLEELRRITRERGALLVFDEVITGFRLAPGGAAERFGVTPDLACFGKVLGGGFPAAAYGGAASLMDQLSPEGSVYQAGTLSGNPVAMAAGDATLKALGEGVYAKLEEFGRRLEAGVNAALGAAGVRGCFQRVGSMATLFFTEGPVEDFEGAKRTDRGAFRRFFWAMARRGVYLPPSPLEAWFLNAALEPKLVRRIVEAVEASLRELQSAPTG